MATVAPTQGGLGPDARHRIKTVAFYTALTLLALIFVGPLVWMIATSFKDEVEAVARPPTWIPKTPTTEGYDRVLQTGSETPVLRWLLNSIVAALVHSVLVVLTASAAAYAFAHMEFRGRKLLFGLVIATLFVPPIILIVPNYQIVSYLGWLDSLAAIIIPGAAGAFGVFFMRQFFSALPRDLLDAAAVDGANDWQIFRRIVLPLSKPALATLTVLSFLTNWNEFLWSLFVLFSPERLTLPPGLATMQRAVAINYNLVMVGGVVASIPVLMLFVFAQRFIIEGISRTGIKG